jgi:hypothetical protein
MRHLIYTIVAASTLLAVTSNAQAQLGGGVSPGGVLGTQGLIPPIPPPAMMPMPSMPTTPTQQWVPEQRQHDPAIGRDIEVPGHYAERTPDGRLIQPPMTVPSPNGRPPIFLPGAKA